MYDDVLWRPKAVLLPNDNVAYDRATTTTEVAMNRQRAQAERHAEPELSVCVLFAFAYI